MRESMNTYLFNYTRTRNLAYSAFTLTLWLQPQRKQLAAAYGWQATRANGGLRCSSSSTARYGWCGHSALWCPSSFMRWVSARVLKLDSHKIVQYGQTRGHSEASRQGCEEGNFQLLYVCVQHCGEYGYMLIGLGTGLPCIVLPVLIEGKADAGKPWGQRYWVKASVWIAIFSYIGNYFWTHYFYQLLGAQYTFPSWRLNDVC